MSILLCTIVNVTPRIYLAAPRNVAINKVYPPNFITKKGENEKMNLSEKTLCLFSEIIEEAGKDDSFQTYMNRYDILTSITDLAKFLKADLSRRIVMGKMGNVDAIAVVIEPLAPDSSGFLIQGSGGKDDVKDDDTSTSTQTVDFSVVTAAIAKVPKLFSNNVTAVTDTTMYAEIVTNEIQDVYSFKRTAKPFNLTNSSSINISDVIRSVVGVREKGAVVKKEMTKDNVKHDLEINRSEKSGGGLLYMDDKNSKLAKEVTAQQRGTFTTNVENEYKSPLDNFTPVAKNKSGAESGELGKYEDAFWKDLRSGYIVFESGIGKYKMLDSERSNLRTEGLNYINEVWDKHKQKRSKNKEKEEKGEPIEESESIPLKIGKGGPDPRDSEGNRKDKSRKGPQNSKSKSKNKYDDNTKRG